MLSIEFGQKFLTTWSNNVWAVVNLNNWTPMESKTTHICRSIDSNCKSSSPYMHGSITTAVNRSMVLFQNSWCIMVVTCTFGWLWSQKASWNVLVQYSWSALNNSSYSPTILSGSNSIVRRRSRFLLICQLLCALTKSNTQSCRHPILWPPNVEKSTFK